MLKPGMPKPSTGLRALIFPTMQKRVLILIDNSQEIPKVTAYSSAKVLLEKRADLGVAYQTLMNHLSKHDKPYTKGTFQIHRADLQRAEKGA